MSDTWILDEAGQPVREPDLLKWSQWFEPRKRILAQATVADGVFVSTVFLGVDHNFYNDGPPVLWETMIFGGPYNLWMERYASRAEAEAGHARVVTALEAGMNPDKDEASS